MQHRFPTFLACLALFASISASPTAATALSSPAATVGSYSVLTDFVYATVLDGMGAPMDLELDLYLPIGATSATPTVIWIHGGSWDSGSKDAPPIEPLAAQGYAVASINYRLIADGIWPSQIHDCKAAVRWLRANAAVHNLDPDRIGVWGGSAGGHLALLLATSSDVETAHIGSVVVDLEGTVGNHLSTSSAVQAAGAWFPPTEFLRMSQYPNLIDPDAATSAQSRLIGSSIQTVPALTKTASPLSYLGQEDPPLYCAHGSADLVVPLNQSSHFIRTAAEVFGLDAGLEVRPDVGHGVSNFSVTTPQVFFDRVLLNLATPTLSVVVTRGATFDEDGLAGTAPSFVISRTGSTGSALDVQLAWGGSVIPGSDVAALPLRVTIAPGSPSALIQPSALNDALVEGTEELRLSIRYSTDYRLDVDQREATLTLLDDEMSGGLPTVTLTAPDATATEGGDSGAFRIQRTGSTANALTVSLRFTGDALRLNDFLDISPTATIPAGAAQLDLALVPVDDTIAEPSEIVTAGVTASSDYVVGANSQAEIALFDDDRTSGVPILNMAQSILGIGESAGAGRVTVYATNVLGVQSTIAASVSGSASVGVDYAFPNAPIMPPFGVGASVAVTPLQDTLIEGTEEIVFQLLPVSGFQLGIDNQLRVLIGDDDTPTLPPAPLTLDMSSMQVGGACSVSVSDGASFAPYVVYASQGRAFVDLAVLAHPVLILPVDLLPISTSALDFFGRSDFVVTVPYDPVLVERRYYFQALALDSPLRMSNRVERTPLAR